MARKGNQQKNGVDRRSSKHKKKGSDSGSVLPDMKERGKANEIRVPAEEVLTGNPNFTESKSNYAEEESNANKKSGKFVSPEKQGMDVKQIPEQSVCSGSNSGECIEKLSSEDVSGAREDGLLLDNYNSPKRTRSNLGCSLSGLRFKNMMGSVSDNVAVKSLRVSTMSILRRASVWLEKQRPYFVSLTTSILNVQDYVKVKIEQAYPIVLKWLFHLGNIILLLSMVWLDCTLRGIDSFLRMGTTSFFSVVWCSILSIIAMAGIFKFVMILAVAVFVGLFIGFVIGVLVLAVSGTIFLWFYGSFWTTSLIIFLGGLTFMLKHERLALLITTAYSIYCAWTYVGWLGVLLGLNLSFFSSDALIYFLKNNINQQRGPGRTPEQTAGMQGRPGMFNGEAAYASSSETGPGLSADRSPGVPSTGNDSEVTSEDEVVRLLNCEDHYSALCLSRYEDVDVSILKREYRKKAMLVHPDKNMGNEKAAEAFKKLQNAYEVLLDSLKRKEYDDELRREELLNYFRRFQGASQKNGGHSFFTSGYARSDGDSEDPVGDSRQIACKKCNNFHVWVHTKKTKSRARWCQDCKDFHQAKDGDGWVEQSSQPLLFGLMQKVDAPCAYVCADSRIYDATEWYICQGMRCGANTHKPSFHVNTSVTSKQNTGKGTSSGARGGRVPTSNMEENMTEEEFLEWLQNAVQAGMFDNFSGGGGGGGGICTDNPSPKGGSGGSNSKSSSSKRKKKGKKW